MAARGNTFSFVSGTQTNSEKPTSLSTVPRRLYGFTFEHLIDVVFEVLHPPVVTQVGAEHFLRHAVLCHVDHGVSVLGLVRRREATGWRAQRYPQHPAFTVVVRTLTKFNNRRKPQGTE